MAIPFDFFKATEHIMDTCRGEIKKRTMNKGYLMKFYRLLGEELAPRLMKEINKAMKGKDWGEGRQLGGAFGGNGETSYNVTPDGLELIWSGQRILYIEYGAGAVAVDHPYAGGEMIDGYAPEDHKWVFRNVFTSGWEPIAPYYKFKLKLKAGKVLSHEQLNKIFNEAMQGASSEIHRRIRFNRLPDATYEIKINVL